MAYLLLILGFVLLIKGADFFVDGAAAIAGKFHVSTVIVGLTIVALGTSLPEFSVSLSAAMAGSNALALSNVLGSNVFNTLVVVGCSAILAPFVIDKTVADRDLGVNIGVTLLLALFCLSGVLQRWMGLIFLFLLAAYIVWLIIAAKKESDAAGEEEENEISAGKCLVWIVLGAAGIFAGGDLTVENAKIIAQQWGMSEAMIGLTIVALGTSLPELVTSVVAAKKGESGLSLGNAIGSNIFNVLFILGSSAAIHPLAVHPDNRYDVWILLGIAVFIFALAKIKDRMSRTRGVLFLLIYAVYMVYIILR